MLNPDDFFKESIKTLPIGGELWYSAYGKKQKNLKSPEKLLAFPENLW